MTKTLKDMRTPTLITLALRRAAFPLGWARLGASLFTLLTAAAASAQSNIWTSATDGNWQDPANWSLGAPSTNQSMYLTNAGSKTVTLDAVTSGSYPETLTISNLTVGAPSGATNLLALLDAGTNTPLHILNDFFLFSGGALLMTNAALQVDSTNQDNPSIIIDGTAGFSDALFNATNGLTLAIGQAHPGSLSLTNSQFISPFMEVGLNANGTLNLINTLATFPYGMYIADGGASGIVTIVGGQWSSVGGNIDVGEVGNGQMIVAGPADVEPAHLTVGRQDGSAGTLVVLDGTVNVASGLTVGGLTTNTTGSLVISNGQVNTLNLTIGPYGVGTLDIFGGGLNVSYQATLATNPHSTGALNIAGGSNYIAQLFIGSDQLYDPNSNEDGRVLVTGGSLTANEIDVVNGASLTLDGGLLRMNVLNLTNGGTFTNLSGTLDYTGPYQVQNGSTAAFLGGDVIAGTNFTASSANGLTSMVLFANCTFTATNGVTGFGNDGATNTGTGTVTATISNATVNTLQGLVGSSVGGRADVYLYDAAVWNIGSDLTIVSPSLAVPSTLNLAGGSLVAASGPTRAGLTGNGQINVLGGSHTFRDLTLGSADGTGTGSLLLMNGHLTILHSLSANFIVVGCGDLDGSGGTVIVGQDHDATMDVTCGNATNINTMLVGYTANYSGTFSLSGGLTLVTNTLIVGDTDDCVNGPKGNVTHTAGFLGVTNGSHTAVLDVRNGTFTLNGGALVVDKLNLSHPCGLFINQGGTVSYQQLVLPPNPPPLALTLAPNPSASSLTLTWPSVYVGYALEQSPDLTAGSWTSVSQTPTDDGVTRSVTISTTGSAAMFYRLVRP